MADWCLGFQALLGQAVPRDEVEYVTEFRYVPEGWTGVAYVCALVGVVWFVVWMYRHEGRIGASQRRRMWLAGFRSLVLLTLAVILLEPARVRILRRWIDSYAVVLVDTSSSMDLADIYRDSAAGARVERVMDASAAAPTRRIQLAHSVLASQDRRFLTELANHNRIKLYGFGEEPELLATIRALREQPANDAIGAETRPDALLGADETPIPTSATGAATNIERAVRRAVDSLGSSPVAAVVVFSDGGFNQGAAAEEVARFARERRIPLHVVGIGDPSSPQNVRVTEVLAPPNAFQRDPFSISVRLSAEGLDGESVAVQLRERRADAGDEGRIVDTRRVTVARGGAVEAVAFERKQERIGRYVYSVEVPVLAGESVADDNIKQTTVNVIDARTRVLLIASGPGWEYQFLSRLLMRDDTFDVSCWLQSADLSAVRDGDTIIDHLPTRADELYAYDVIVLLDPDREELDEPWCRLLDTYVTEYGGGVLFAAGRAFTSGLMRDRTLKPFHDLLPVVLDPEADLMLNEIGYYQLGPSPIESPQTAFGHPVMKLADDPASTKLEWEDIAAVHWHYPVLREKPVATVLMRHGGSRMRNAAGGHVLAAVQFVGAGRTGFLGFDGTWRWRRKGVERYDRFWVQLIRYLAEGKLLGGAKRGMILTEADQFSLGETVSVTARLFDREYKPLRMDQIAARYSVDHDSGEFTLSALRDRVGWFEGRFVPDRTGNYRITVAAPDPTSRETVEIAREIQVTRPNIEVLRPQMAKADLLALAEHSHGGRYFEIDEAYQIPAIIPDLHEEIPIRSRPTSLWDNSLVLTLLLTLLTVEWGVRKWSRML
jgi:hypothetical protein